MIGELDDVLLLHETEAEADNGEPMVMPKGARGTVVMILGEGEGYTVEFEQPFHALVEVRAEDLRPDPMGMTREQLAASLSR